MTAKFVSIWDDGVNITTSCNYDEETKIVSDIECADVDGLDLDVLQEEYVLLPDGTMIHDFISED